MKNVDFGLKNVDFGLKNVEFTIKKPEVGPAIYVTRGTNCNINPNFVFGNSTVNAEVMENCP